MYIEYIRIIINNIFLIIITKTLQFFSNYALLNKKRALFYLCLYSYFSSYACINKLQAEYDVLSN